MLEIFSLNQQLLHAFNCVNELLFFPAEIQFVSKMKVKSFQQRTLEKSRAAIIWFPRWYFLQWEFYCGCFFLLHTFWVFCIWQSLSFAQDHFKIVINIVIACQFMKSLPNSHFISIQSFFPSAIRQPLELCAGVELVNYTSFVFDSEQKMRNHLAQNADCLICAQCYVLDTYVQNSVISIHHHL